MNFQKHMVVALAEASLSKDPTTKAGTVILGPEGEKLSTGWNGAPRGCKADEDERNQRPIKYKWFAHSEANAIFNAARVGIPLKGSTMVCTHYPCMNCAIAIVQAGIVRVVVQSPDVDFLERWKDDIALSTQLFEECGVEVELVI